MGGRRGGSNGGASGAAYPGYSTGSAGGGALGGISNDTGAVLKIIGDSVISNNVGAGGGASGIDVGGIGNKGMVLITADNFAAMAGNVGGSGTGGTSAGAATNVITLDNTGVATTGGTPGVGTTSSNNCAIDTMRPTASTAVTDSALKSGETSLVTFTFSEAVSGFISFESASGLATVRKSRYGSHTTAYSRGKDSASGVGSLSAT